MQIKSIQSEIKLQAECFQWAWNEMPMTRRLLFHVPNGGFRSAVEAGQLKASGVIAGIPDLLFIWKGRTYAFELKTEIGRLSPQQVEVHKAWHYQGVTVWVIRDFETFQRTLRHLVGGGQIIG